MWSSKDKYSMVWQRSFFLTDYLRDTTTGMRNPEAIREMFKDMTYRQSKVFRAVIFMTNENPDGVSLKELSRKLKISPASASEMIEVLVKKGVLTRAKDLNDRRSVRIRVSEKMAEELVRIDEFYSEKTREMTSGLTEEELTTLLGIFEKMYKLVQAREADNP